MRTSAADGALRLLSRRGCWSAGFYTWAGECYALQPLALVVQPAMRTMHFVSICDIVVCALERTARRYIISGKQSSCWTATTKGQISALYPWRVVCMQHGSADDGEGRKRCRLALSSLLPSLPLTHSKDHLWLNLQAAQQDLGYPFLVPM